MQILCADRQKRIIEAKDLIKNYPQDSAVSVSGGKDSLVALDLSIKVGLKNVVYCNTTMTLPGTEEYLQELEDYYGIKIKEVKAPRNFFDLVEDIGFPSRRLRWCCEVYKFGPLADFVQKKRIKYLITGIRAEESRKRKGYEKISRNPLIPATQINPILDWDEIEIWDYIRENKLPYHRLYDMGYDRLGCWICPFQSNEGFKRLEKLHPNLHKKLIDSLYKNIKKFGKVGVSDIDDYIKNYAWVRNALPIRNIIVGLIEYEIKNNYVKYHIKCKNKSNFSKILKNINLLKAESQNFRIDTESLSIKFKSIRLNLNKILFYCEKQVNCVGCGACRSLCPQSCIELKTKSYHINFSKCSFCYNCLSTSKMRGACIARNYAPVRKKFARIDLSHTNVKVYKDFLNLNNNIGTIITRKDIKQVKKKLNEYFVDIILELPKVSRFVESQIYFSKEFKLKVKRDHGFTNIQVNAYSRDVEKRINSLISGLK